ncbi:WDR70 family WD repeat protein [Schizosaccharomyces japonicus yFS275]|uniref:WDR70 family WD repeat protein n=1 Tax=Schizosaccharomyces japonicus (strain yFS275 / FY16936) TaxID=402676 RepID=B6JYB2_SCHJY|nr:WDR70 family WD repeat protein [Schizosaccharomyces japonicus yFS275]EEB06530.2 WDR70 family WD repeat protein [Schizosaccharomyces japonicus yFS275]
MRMSSSDENAEVFDGMEAAIPASFGKQQVKQNPQLLLKQFERNKEQDELCYKTTISKEPISQEKSDDDDDSSSSDGWSDESDDEDVGVPSSHELVLKEHSKCITTGTFDVSGTRFISGSLDNTIRCWDFHGMDAYNPKPFHVYDPANIDIERSGRYPVVKLTASPKNTILTLYSHSKPMVLDTNGKVLADFVKGDAYIRDMLNTKGHVMEITDGCWKPQSSQVFLTCSADSTARIWDVERTKSQIQVFVHRTDAAAGISRPHVSACAWNPSDENQICTAVNDGSVHFWDLRSRLLRPSSKIMHAHAPNTNVQSLLFTKSGTKLLSRGGDNLVKVWDTRNIKTALAVSCELKTPSFGSNAIFSPNEKLVLVGNCASSSEGCFLNVLNAEDLSLHARLSFALQGSSVGESSITSISWNDRINQLAVGMSSGDVHVLFSAMESLRGAKDAVLKGPKTKHIDDNLTNTVYINALDGSGGTSNGLGLVEETNESISSYFTNARKRKNEARKNPILSRQPQIGRVSEAIDEASVPFASMRDEDPREALLRYAELAKKDPIFTKTYTETQPKPVYQNVTEAEDLPDPQRSIRKRQKSEKP